MINTKPTTTLPKLDVTFTGKNVSITPVTVPFTDNFSIEVGHGFNRLCKENNTKSVFYKNSNPYNFFTKEVQHVFGQAIPKQQLENFIDSIFFFLKNSNKNESPEIPTTTFQSHIDNIHLSLNIPPSIQLAILKHIFNYSNEIHNALITEEWISLHMGLHGQIAHENYLNTVRVR